MESLADIEMGVACVGFNPVNFSREIPLKNIQKIAGYDKVGGSCKNFKQVMELLKANLRALQCMD